jgi:hypothetical protein
MIRDLQQLRVLVAEHEFIVANDISPRATPPISFTHKTGRNGYAGLWYPDPKYCPFCLTKRPGQFQGIGTPLIR